MRLWERRALAHEHDAFERVEPAGERVLIGDMRGKRLDLRRRMKLCQSAAAERRALIVVEQRNAHHRRSSPQLRLPFRQLPGARQGEARRGGAQPAGGGRYGAARCIQRTSQPAGATHTVPATA